MTYSPSNVFCDWLDVTYSPTETMTDAARMFFLDNGFLSSFRDDKKTAFKNPDGHGSVVIEERHTFARVSASGQVLARLRVLGLLDNFLAMLSECPHRVTRLDAAHDVPVDGADVVVPLYHSFPSGKAKLSHKPIPVVADFGYRSDGRETGSVYFGKRSKARISACVYDKQAEALANRSEVLPPTTRYELRFTQGFASLRDAASPESLFWAYASPTLLAKPADYTPVDWVPCDGSTHWDFERPERSPYESLARRVEFSPELAAFVDLANEVGGDSRRVLDRLIRKRLDELFRDSSGGSN